MGRSIVITSGKGGVGKTTATANLGTALANMGKSVVLIDADIGLRNLDVVMGLESRVVYTSMDVIEGKCELKKALVTDRRVPNLKLLAASQKANKEDISPEQMKEICGKLKEEFDYVLIDSPAGIERGFKNAAAGAQEAIVVTTPEVTAVRDADKIIGLLQNEDIQNPGLILNRFSPQMVRKGDMLSEEDVLEILSIELLGIVPEDKNILISTNRGFPLTLNMRSVAAEAFGRIARKLEGEEVDFRDLIYPGGFMAKIRKLFGKNGRG
jgi:septum site-determining protein MinD